jgi:predicted metal-dependent HD superfamily phosphohydrolase
MGSMDLSERWPLPDGATLRDELVAAYADPLRGYHDGQHLSEVLDRLDELAAAGTSYDAMPVLLAAWFHDAVYDGERDAEERSAAWAENALSTLVPADVLGEVARLVRITETHLPDDDDANGCALSDADLGILAASSERYEQYRAAVRQEYAHLPDEVFLPGRSTVLRSLASKPHLFHTPYARQHWEEPARANVERELASLER